MATSIQCNNNNKSARDDADAQERRRRDDELTFGFAGGGGGGHTTTITLDGCSGGGGGCGRGNKQSQLVEPQSSNHLQRQQQADRPTLVDLLIDSQCDWRRLISEANGPHEKLSQHLSEMQIKRQEIIHELIQTERHHCLTLALMRQVYLAGLLRLNELRQRNNSNSNPASGAGSGQSSNVADPQVAAASAQRHQGEPIDIERLFPALEELIQAHELFFAHLRLRLVECCGQTPNERRNPPLVGIIGPLGDLLIEQFKLSPETTTTGAKRHKLKCHAQSMNNNKNHTAQQQAAATVGNTANTNGYKLLQAYAKFCGQHYESSRYYKQLLQFDKGFKQFIEQCNKQHAACRQRGIPECNLLVAQRLTKYPLLIEQLIKASKDEPNDEEEKLRQALGECRALLAELNSQLARKESFERLLDIYAQFSPKSHTIFYHKSALRFTKHDLLQHKRLRQLMHSDDQVRIWSATRRKLFPVLCLILNDIIVFLRVDQQQQEQQISSSQQVSARLAHLDQVAPGRAEDARHDGHEMATAALAVAQHQQAANTNSSLATTTTTTTNYLHTPVPSATAPTVAPSVRYYFANIDNKSSVISLSKLLVREKAVEETEPRVYLISSSPKQPEMYELAFISRRHQTTFIDKLKTAIGAHNKSKSLSAGSCVSGTFHLASSGQEITGGYKVSASAPAAASSSSSECCSLTSCSSSVTSSSRGRSVGAGSESPSDEDYDDDDDEHENALTLTGGNGGTSAGDSATTNHRQVSSTTAMTASHQQVDLENLELDIEQDLVPAPSCLDLATCCESDETKDVAQELRAESATPSSAQIGETGLSERARDSCDDLSSPRLWLGQGCRRQKARGNRKRRFQRPRQVSNQSTDSGTTSGTSLTSGIGSGDCMELGGTSHTSGSEQSQSESAKQVDNCESTHTSGVNSIMRKDQQEQEEEEEEEEDLDSGRGRDDSSSSSSSSSAASTCHDSMTTGGGSSAGGGQRPLVETSELAVALDESPKSTSGELDSSAHMTAATTTTTTGGSVSLTSQQVGGHKLYKPPKQRKLSTVSTISSQMKLLQKLRSVGLLATAGSGGPTQLFQPNTGANHHQTTPAGASLSLCANCIYQQQQQQQQHDALDDTIRGSTMSKRHLQHLRQLSKRRSLFVPEQKLEELRNLRIQLDKDKQEWQEKFDRMQEQLLNERRDLDLARERLKLDRTQIENEREQLYRKLEILKENGILLSPSHKVIITSPDQCARLMSSGGASQQVNHNQQHFQYQASQRLQQPPVYINQQQPQQQQQMGYGQHQTFMMQQQQQPAHLMASARVPVHLSQQQTGVAQQVQQPQPQYSSIRSSGGFMSALPGASFLVKRFGGGGGGGGGAHQPPANIQPINGKLSQSTMTISHHNHLQQQQNHFASQRNHVLL